MSFSRTAGEAFPPVRCILGTRRWRACSTDEGGKMDGWTKVHRGRFLLSPEVYSTYSKSYPNITLGLSNLDGIKNWQNRLW